MMDKSLDDALAQKWEASDLWPTNYDEFTSVSGGSIPNCYFNFCPEVSFGTFGVFAGVVIRFFDSIDQESRFKQLSKEGVKKEKDWRWKYQWIEPLHYSECEYYSILSSEQALSQVNFNAPVSGQVNVAGKTISSPVANISLRDLEQRIDQSDASDEQKAEAKSRLKQFLEYPVVAAIIGGLSSGTVT
ncbi:MAG: hypothetical protein N838_02180 [Thiohalocapsa sp. PB-PSB1]|jgi:hypothetical protein|nr:MAG: hypothetical protein N838_00145 [Thiohalocapsa sp. PB-PSB1]QQO52371.1 MAG: hypothetical protein N838_02180 [Thiohalocapsa sp. PB-PSB1]HCS92567.1 hypothetical protein [Chromatiaceae bacterium]